MPRLRRGAIVLSVLGLASGLVMLPRPAQAQITAKYLADLCRGNTGSPEVGEAMCKMYIAGVTDMHFYSEYETGQRFFCVKETSVTGDDIRKLYLAWLDKNPSMIYQSARYVLLKAMIARFPCK